MWIHLFILAISFGFVLAYDVDMAALYRQWVVYVDGEYLTICGQSFVGGVVFVFWGLFMEHFGLYSLMRLLSRLLMEFSLLLLTGAALFALFSAVALGVNFWADSYSLLLVPFIGLGTAMVTLYLFDFNYPFASRLLPVLFLVALSLGLVNFGIF